MKTINLLFLALFPLGVIGHAQSYLPANDVPVEKFVHRDRTVVPGLMVYGVPWTASRQEFEHAFGPPSGVFYIRDDAVALVYGKQHVFLFEKNILREVSVDSRLFNFVLDAHVLPHPFLDSGMVTFAPGVKLRMPAAEVATLLPGTVPKAEDMPQKVTYVTEYASVTVWFATISSPEVPSGRKEVFAYTIRGQ